MKQKLRSQIGALITTAMFLLVLFGFAFCYLFVPGRGFSESENRYLAQWPRFSWESLASGEFTEGVEAYLTDQFTGRDAFVGLKAQTEALWGKQENNGIFYGKDGYLIPRYDNTNVDVEQLEKNLETIERFLDGKNGQLPGKAVAMLVPTAQAVLTEKLPPYAPTFDQLAVFAAFEERAPQGSVAPVSAALLQHCEEEIYYRTDHHWTTLGAYYGYRAFCETLGIAGKTMEEFEQKTVSNSFYGTSYSSARLFSTQPDHITAFFPKDHAQYTATYNQSETREGLYWEEYLARRDQYSYFLGGNNPLAVIRSQTENGRRLLILKDSYAHCFAPFVAGDFEEVHLLDLRYYNGSVQSYMEENGITDALVLYGFSSLESETSLVKLNS